MQICKIDPAKPGKKIIDLAVRVIKNGGVAVYPTDTIYGIGANALDKNAVKKIFAIKGREKSKPLSIVVTGIKMAKKYCVVSKAQEEIFRALLPGPFTLIFKKSSLRFGRIKASKQEKIFAGDRNTLALRIPDSKITALVSKKLGIPFTATSANLSGLPGSGDIKKVLKQLEKKKSQIDLVLDVGILPKKKPSIIIDLSGKEPRVIRK